MLCPLSRLRPHDSERFKQFFVAGEPDSCWIWFGSKDGKGYGAYPAGKLPGRKTQRKIGAHRLAYALAFGPFDPVLFVLHRCDTPLCVNPNHLFLGTNKDNIEDMRRKGRATGKAINLTR